MTGEKYGESTDIESFPQANLLNWISCPSLRQNEIKP